MHAHEIGRHESSCQVNGGHGARENADGAAPPAPVSSGMRHDPTNLDHIAYSIVGLGIFGWILSLLLR